jgi:hypothetical protein
MSEPEARTIVLGGGTSGLLAAYELSKYIDPLRISIIGIDIGPRNPIGLQYLHPGDKLKEICEELSLPYHTREVNGAIINKSGVLRGFPTDDLSEPTETIEAVMAHSLKTRGKKWDGSLRTMNNALIHLYNHTKPKSLIISPRDLSEGLEEKLKSIGIGFEKAKIGYISALEKEVMFYPSESPSYAHYMNYDCILNTIPLKSLIELFKIPDMDLSFLVECHESLLSSPIYFGTIPESRLIPPIQEYDFVYSPFHNPWYRLSKSDSKGVYSVEFSNELYAKAFDCQDIITLKYGRISTDNPDQLSSLLAYIQQKDIQSIGRFGRWKSGTLIHQTAEEANRSAKWIAAKIN